MWTNHSHSHSNLHETRIDHNPSMEKYYVNHKMWEEMTSHTFLLTIDDIWYTYNDYKSFVSAYRDVCAIIINRAQTIFDGTSRLSKQKSHIYKFYSF